MHKPGESVVSIDAGSAQDWLHLLAFGCGLAAASAILGAVVGLIFRGRIVAQIIASVIVSIAFSAVLEWRLGGPGEWSWRYPITSLAYLFAPAVLFIGAPILFAALLVGRLCMRHKSI